MVAPTSKSPNSHGIPKQFLRPRIGKYLDTNSSVPKLTNFFYQASIPMQNKFDYNKSIFKSTKMSRGTSMETDNASNVKWEG